MSVPDEDPRPITLILDRSALLAYPWSVHVGEPVGEVIQDRCRFGITAVTVVSALALAADAKHREHMERLVRHESCAVLTTWGEDWEELDYWRGITGRDDVATTVLASLEYGAQILTAEGQRYGEPGDLPINYMPEQ